MYQRFAEVYDSLMRDVDYAAWASRLYALMARRGFKTGSALMDAACGTGNIALPLAKMGYAVTGCDISEDMLAVAAGKARKAGLRIPFARMDIKNMESHRPFDIVNCSCDGVNYLLDRDEVSAFFTSAARALKTGGLLLFDVSSEYKLEKILGCNTFGEDDGRTAYIWKNNFDPASRLIEMNLSFFVKTGSNYERFCERHIQRAHGLEELRRALADCGFADVEV